MTSDVCLQRSRAAVTVILGDEFPSPEVVSGRAETDTSGCRKYRENLRPLLFTLLRRVRNSDTSLLIPTAHKLRFSSISLSDCYQPEQLKTSHISEISHIFFIQWSYIHRCDTIRTSYYAGRTET